MDFLSFANFFSIDAKPNIIFHYVFDKDRIPEFKKIYVDWDYDTENHNIRNLVLREPKTYGANLKKICKCLTCDSFMKIIDNINFTISNDSMEQFAEDAFSYIENEIGCNSPFLQTLIILRSHFSNYVVKKIFVVLCMMYTLFRRHYSHLSKLYDITDIETYDKIYCNIVTVRDILKYYDIYKATEKVTMIKEKKNIYTNKNDIPFFIASNVNDEISNITISSLTGQYLFTDEITKSKIVSFLKKGGKLLLILTQPDMAKKITKAMETEDNPYIDPEYSLAIWNNFSDKYKNQIEIRFVDVPILHNLICIDDTKIHMYLYTYPDDYDLPNPQVTYTPENIQFQLFMREINHLRKISISSKQKSIIDGDFIKHEV